MTSSDRILFLDDAVHSDCPRDGLDRLFGIGGISVPFADARRLNDDIDGLCEKFGFPRSAPFKWSPQKGQWFKRALDWNQKAAFFEEVLACATNASAEAIVAICEPSARPMKGARNAQVGSLLGVLERFHLSLGRSNHGIIVVDRPPGSKTDEERYLLECLDLLEKGSSFADFGQFACPIVSMPSTVSRLLQVADIVVSITTAAVAGHSKANEVLGSVTALLRSDKDRVGGVGVKLHPDYRLRNLYHWLFDDPHHVQGSVGYPMPLKDYPFPTSPDRFRD